MMSSDEGNGDGSGRSTNGAMGSESAVECAVEAELRQWRGGVFSAARDGDWEAVHSALDKLEAPVRLRAVNVPEMNSEMRLLHWFARCGHVEAVEALLRVYGADVHARDREFRCALHFASTGDWRSPAIHRVLDTVGTLLFRGARCSARDNSGMTPMHYAVQAGHTELVQMYLTLRVYKVYLVVDRSEALSGDGGDGAHGDNGEASSKDGAPLGRAREPSRRFYSKESLEAWARSRGLEAVEGTSGARMRDPRVEGNVFRVLPQSMGLPRSSIEAPNNYEERPLHLAARSSKAMLCSMLLRAGARPDATDYRGRTPLHHAVLLGEAAEAIETVRTLVPRTNEVNVQDNDGATALHLASERGFRSCVLELLKSRSIDVSLKDRNGQTALDCATRVDEQDVCTVLREAAVLHGIEHIRI